MFNSLLYIVVSYHPADILRTRFYGYYLEGPSASLLKIKACMYIKILRKFFDDEWTGGVYKVA